ncbi:MAG TPA: 4Fe-4S dicluster domain-containing protein [Candidatus Aenigmarchaeota archaeon]|nr:4Fe-4S dicluster domain-containing protein [Candidatus Aenigmarchaeota archaeon]
MLAIAKELLKQLFKKPFTNRFPAKYIPKSVTGFLERARTGKVKINPPVEVPPGFRGKIEYDEKKCIRCKLCTRVCPAKAVVYSEREKKIKYYLFRCTFCGQCVDVCPVNALTFTKEFLLAGYRRD